jgi:hypothetical protein
LKARYARVRAKMMRIERTMTTSAVVRLVHVAINAAPDA